MKTYRVVLEYRIRETIEVSANDEDEAEKIAMNEVEISLCNAELYDSKVTEINK